MSAPQNTSRDDAGRAAALPAWASFDGPPGLDGTADALVPAAASCAGPPLEPVPLQLDWSPYDAYGAGDAYAGVPAHGAGYGKAASLCIGSRQCQKARGGPDDAGVMCPSFRITHDDLHSTRGRAARLRDALNGVLGERPFADGALEAAMDLCVACKGCKRECPNGVDMAALRAETLAQRWRHRPLPWRTRWFARLPQRFAALRRWRWLLSLRRLPGAAALGERWFGIAARRSLPRLAAVAFLDRPPAARASPTTGADDGRREVVLLVDCFSNHLEPAIAASAQALLMEAGYRVHLLRPPAGAAPVCCGRTAYSAGLVDEARQQAQRLLDALGPHLDQHRVVVGLEPSCLSMLRDEVAALGLDAARVQQLATSALMLEEFLARELDARRWSPDRAAGVVAGPPQTVWVHGHCHQKAHGTLKALRKVLKAVPGLHTEWIESSCCGMAGAFGYEAEHYEASMRMAELSLLPAVRRAPPEALLLASGTSCRHQILDGSGRQALHLAPLLRRLLAAPASGRP